MMTDSSPKLSSRPATVAIVRRHPLLSYFALAYAISWLGWLPYILSMDGFGILRFRFPEFLGTTQFAGLMPGAYLGPLTSALIVTAVAEGGTGLRLWGRRLFRWRVGWPWYVIVLVGLPVVVVLGALPLPGALADLHAPPPAMLLRYLPMLAVQVFTTGVAEEPGWRDFALPRLQRRYGPLLGTLILAPLWAVWHFPLFLTTWSPPGGKPLGIAEFVLVALVLSVVITWLFNRTGESLPLVLLFHANFNTFAGAGWPYIFPALSPWPLPLMGIGAVAVLLVVFTRGRLGAPT